MAIYEQPASPSHLARPRTLTALAVPLALFLAALLPRLAALGRYVTPDEPVWVFRSIGFRQALLSADWANTLQSGHPGVITTWLGALGVQLRLWLDPAAQTHLDWLAGLSGFNPENGFAIQHLYPFLDPSRVVMAAANSLGIVAIWWLARDRLGPEAALLGGLLLALDPFSAGLAGILHLDALLATLMLVAFMLALPKRGRETGVGPGLMALSGLFTGLAILNKIPAIFLLGAVPAVHLWCHWRAGTLRRGLLGLLAWIAAAGLAGLIFLPAFWLGPQAVVDKVQALTGRLVDAAARPNFFLGQTTLNPGPAYYPLVLAFRLSPAASLGLLALAGLVLARLLRRRLPALPPNLFWLLAFGLGFALFLNVSATRHQRYLVPATLPLILAAAAAAEALARRWFGDRRLVLAGLVLLQAGFLLASWPYPLAAYNWLAGGSGVGQRVFPADWGESAGAAARRAGELPQAAAKTLYTANVPSTAPFFPGRVVRYTWVQARRLSADDLIVVSAPDVQQAAAEGHSLFDLPAEALVTVVSAPAGLEARVYAGLEMTDLGLAPIPVVSRQMTFNQSVRLVLAGATAAAWPEPLVALLAWQAPEAADFTLRLALVDEQNHPWLSLEEPLLDEAEQPPAYWLPGATAEVLYTMRLPADLPPGPYALQASLFDGQGARLGAFGPTGDFAGVAVSIARLAIEAPAEQPPIEPPVSLDGGPPQLLGRDELPAGVDTGSRLTLDLWWRNEPETPPGARLVLGLGPLSLETPLATGGWRAGQVYHLRPTWSVPADGPAGSQPVTLRLVNAQGQPLWPSPFDLGQVNVRAVERQYELPAGLEALEVSLGQVASLQQATAALQGEEVIVDVIWQAEKPDGLAYTTFVHLLDENGAMVDQGDRPPAMPTNTWVNGQVIAERYRLPAPPPGAYTIALGLYEATSGARLPMREADGGPLPDDRYTLELVIP